MVNSPQTLIFPNLFKIQHTMSGVCDLKIPFQNLDFKKNISTFASSFLYQEKQFI